MIKLTHILTNFFLDTKRMLLAALAASHHDPIANATDVDPKTVLKIGYISGNRRRGEEQADVTLPGVRIR